MGQAASTARPKTITLWFEGQSLNVCVFPGTERRELLDGIAEALGLPTGAPLRFRDADGTVVLFSASVPDGAVLHVTSEAGFVPAVESARLGVAAAAAASAAPTASAAAAVPTTFATAATSTPALDWRTWELFSDDCSERTSVSFRTTVDSESYWALSRALPTAGKHYIVLNITCASYQGRRPCCLAIGLVDATMRSMPSGHINDGRLPFVFSLMGVGKGASGALCNSTSGAEAARVGLLVDADARTLHVIKHDQPSSGAYWVGALPRTALRVCVQGPKHAIFAEILPLEQPPGFPWAAEQVVRGRAATANNDNDATAANNDTETGEIE